MKKIIESVNKEDMLEVQELDTENIQVCITSSDGESENCGVFNKRGAESVLK